MSAPGPQRHSGVPAVDAAPKPFTHPRLTTILLLITSNVFMTFAWYGHLSNTSRPLLIAVASSWGLAFFEYCCQVPANRIGYGQMTLPQLKILQEVITLSVFVPFTVLYMHQGLRLDYLWAALCILGAVYFVFRTPDTH